MVMIENNALTRDWKKELLMVVLAIMQKLGIEMTSTNIQLVVFYLQERTIPGDFTYELYPLMGLHSDSLYYELKSMVNDGDIIEGYNFSTDHSIFKIDLDVDKVSDQETVDKIEKSLKDIYELFGDFSYRSLDLAATVLYFMPFLWKEEDIIIGIERWYSKKYSVDEIKKAIDLLKKPFLI